MANEYKLSYTAEEIDERLTKVGEAILHTAQELTAEQKAQARANIGAADAETVSQIAEKTSGEKIIESINMLTLDMASPKGEWWYGGVKYTEGNAKTDSSCSFRVNIQPKTMYYTALYNAGDLTYINMSGALYYNVFDSNGVCIQDSVGIEDLRTFETIENSSYVILTYLMYASASDAEPSYMPYLSVESPPANYTVVVSEPITFETLQADIDSLKTGKKAQLLYLPKQYDLVVGDTFELFYYGIANCASWDGFYMKVTGGKGKCFKKRFIYTPTAADVGTHKMTFELYDNNMTKLDEASVNLVVSAKATAPASEKVILCVGDSLFNNGTIPDEFYRRLCGTDGTPAGDALSNVTFIGTQRSATNAVPYEGYGGWTFGSYNSEFKQNSFVWITATNHGKTANDQHSVYEDSAGKRWKLETIETDRIKIIGETVSQSIPSASGTLTWVSGGTNQDNIVYSAAEVASGNPFWNEASGAVDFVNYATAQGVAQIDYVYVLLGWNNVGTSPDNYKTATTTFINNLLAAYPNCQIVLLGLQKPSLDGIGDNYGTNTTYNYQNMQDHVWVVEEVYKEIASEIVNVSFINISGQFDTENNMMEWTRPVNARNSKTETYQSNGVHPAQSGSFQIADAAYRKFTADNA